MISNRRRTVPGISRAAPSQSGGYRDEDYQGLTKRMPAVSVKPLTEYSSRKRKMTEDALGGS
jgi:hypothetical protein